MTDATAATVDRATRPTDATTWHHRAVADYAAGRPRTATRALDRAERHLGADRSVDDDAARRLRARILLTRALCVFEGTGRATAEMVLDEAAAVVADEPGDDDLRALVWSQRANVRGRSGDLAGAAELLEQAGTHLPALPALDRTVILINRGLIGCELGRLTAAAADLTTAADLAAAEGLGAQRFMALHNLGWVDYLRGDLPSALAAFDRAGLVDAGVSPAIALLDRGRVMLEAGLIDDAREVLTRAEHASRQDRLGHAALEVRHELARAAWLAGRPDAARLVTGGRRQATRRGAAVWQARLDLLAVRIAPGPATRRRVTAHAAAGADGPGDPTLRIEYAVVAAESALHAGDPAAADRLLARATATAARQPPSLSGLLDLHRVRALHRIAVDDRPGARRELRRAAAVLDRADVATASIDLRTARQLHGRALAELDLELAVRQGAAAALRAIERWRARTLRVPRVRPDPDPVLAGRLAEVRRLSERLRAGVGDPVDADRIRELAELAEQSRNAADAARARRPGAAAPPAEHLRVDVVIGPAALRAAAAATDSTVISYARVGGRLVGVAVDAHRHRLLDLGPLDAVAEAARRLRADLRVSVRPLPASLRAGVAASMTATAAELGRRLVVPFGVRSSRVVVIGSRELTGLPWSMLCPDRPVTVALSATVWARGLGRARAGTGGPVSYAVLTGPRVAQAAAEQRAVRAAWGSGAEIVVPDTGAGLADALTGARLVHVAAHGRHHETQPMFSAIDLADGPTYLHDLEQVPVAAEAVVLAACDVGRARVRPGDEPLGLCAGLLLLGVTSVIAPVAAVADAPTAALMGELHRRLAAGDPGDVALAEAIRTVTGVVGDPDIVAGRAFVQTGTAW